VKWVTYEDVTEIPRLDRFATKDDPLARRDDSSTTVLSYNPSSTDVRHDPGEQDIARLHDLLRGTDLASLKDLRLSLVESWNAVEVELFVGEP
jgi:hypothetical protein